MKYILLAAVLFQAAYSKCPNGCNGHGSCNIHDQCTCFNEDGAGVEYLASDEKIGATCFQHKTADPCNAITGTYACKFDTTDNECKRIVKNEIVPSTVKQYPEWTGADCSRRTCPRSTSWTEVGDNVVDGGVTQTHSCTHQTQVECSDQGLCDRATGLCECFPGFTGSACQRTSCPDDCSGHGTCRSNRDFAYDFAVAKTHQMFQHSDSTELFQENYVATYDAAWDSNHLYGCRCDRGYRGANCALIECPSSDDPLDDKCSTDEDSFAVENFQVQKFAATGATGWRAAYVDSTALEQIPDVCNVPDNVNDATGAKCKAINVGGLKCKFTPAVAPDVAKSIEAEPARCEQDGVWAKYAPGDKNAHFYNGKVYACFGAMSGQDCSGRGICDYSTGQCACFSGYSGTSCSKIEELV